MERVIEILLINGVTATLLAVPLAIVARYLNRPSIVHALWVVILLKLLTPPIVEVAALPNLAATAPPAQQITTPASPATASPAPAFTAEARTAPLPSKTPLRARLADVLIGLWVAGGATLIGLTVYRAIRFRRALSVSIAAPTDLIRRAQALARDLGLDRCPPLRMIPGRLPPMLWSPPGTCEVLFPSELLLRLDVDERDALIAHELAHVRRKDHWVRFLELAALVLFWWLPSAWWARRELRIAEEKSCDALVLRSLPGHGRAYASGLLKTLEFLAGRATPVPSLATGARGVGPIKERLTMIMNSKTRPEGIGRARKATVAAMALAVLLIFPTWAKRSSSGEPAGDAGRSAERVATTATHDEVRALKQKQHSLELEIERLQLRLAELHHELGLHRATAVSPRDSRQARSVEDAVRAELEYAERLRGTVARQRELEMARTDKVAVLKHELRRAARELEKAEARGELGRARELEAHAHHLAERLERAAVRAQSRIQAYFDRTEELDREQAWLEDELETLRRERDGAEDEQLAKELELAIEELRRKLSAVEEERRRTEGSGQLY